MKKILLVRPGSVHPAIREVHGDYDEWFVNASELGADSARASSAASPVDVFDPTMDDGPPEGPDSYGGVLITGSPAAAFGSEPWIAATEGWIRRWADQQVALLGVCFGAQIIATALGGRVIRNPHGKELGTVRIELNEEARRGSLFRDFPSSFPAQSFHDDCIDRLPDGACLLASSPGAEVQAYRVGASIHAVQFHPEIRSELMRDMVRFEVESGGIPPSVGLEIESRIEPTPESRSLLRRFFAAAIGSR